MNTMLTADELSAIKRDGMSRLRWERVRRGLTIRDVCEAINISSPSVLCYWEEGKSSPRFDAAMKLVTFYGVDAVELIGAARPRTPRPRKPAAPRINPHEARNQTIAAMHREGKSLREIAQAFNISRQRVSQIVLRINGPAAPKPKQDAPPVKAVSRIAIAPSETIYPTTVEPTKRPVTRLREKLRSIA